MKKFVSLLVVLVLFCATSDCFAADGGISLGSKIEGCIKNPISCTKMVLEKTGKAAYGVAEKTGKAAYGVAEKTGKAAYGVVEKTGKAAYGVAEKTGKAVWGLTVGNVQKLVNK